MVARKEDPERDAEETDVGMSAGAEFSGTTAVREVHRFDETRLAQWLAAHQVLRS